MSKKLLIVAAVCALISMACFSALNLLGGFHRGLFGHGMPWRQDWTEEGPDMSRDLPFAGAERLDISYPAEIVYTQGAQPRFTVTGPKRLIDNLKLDGGSLYGPDHGFHFGRHHHRDLHITIVSPNTREFDLSGAEKLILNDIDQDSLVLHASGAADIRGSGRARRLEAHISGAGDLNLGELPVDEAVISISGAGDAKLDARRSADVSISGAGHVRLKTRPANLQTHISGFGSVDAPDSAPPPASSAPAPAAPAAAKAPA